MLPEAEATGRCEVRSESYVFRVDTNAKGRVTGVSYFALCSEALIAGTDKVFSSIDYTLTANVEDLELTGIADLNATGNARARRFYERNGWYDAGDLAYQAQIAGGSITVPCRRYEKHLKKDRSGS
jgi:hypothetical protein